MQLPGAFADTLKHPIVLKNFEASNRDAASQRVPRVRVAMKERLELIILTEKRREDLLGCERRGKRKVSSGDPFSEAQEVWLNVRLLHRKHCPGPPEPRRHF